MQAPVGLDVHSWNLTSVRYAAIQDLKGRGKMLAKTIRIVINRNKDTPSPVMNPSAWNAQTKPNPDRESSRFGLWEASTTKLLCLLWRASFWQNWTTDKCWARPEHATIWERTDIYLAHLWHILHPSFGCWAAQTSVPVHPFVFHPVARPWSFYIIWKVPRIV